MIVGMVHHPHEKISFPEERVARSEMLEASQKVKGLELEDQLRSSKLDVLGTSEHRQWDAEASRKDTKNNAVNSSMWSCE